MVNHIIPETYKEALSYLSSNTYKVIAGGTDLMIQKRGTRETAPKFETDMLYCFNLEELKYVLKIKHEIHVGSMTSLETLLYHADTPSILKKVIAEMASPGIRNVATLAGNIANASPAGDSLVALYLLDAKVVLESLKGKRIVPIELLIKGPRQVGIEKDEIIKEIIILDQEFSNETWIKVGGRRADAISKISFCGVYKITRSKIVDFRVAFGAVYKTVLRSKELESMVIGKTIKEVKENINTIISLYEAMIKPIDDQRSNRVYRLQVAKNILNHFITDIK